MGNVKHDPYKSDELEELHEHAREVRQQAKRACAEAQALIARIDSWRAWKHPESPSERPPSGPDRSQK